MGNKQVKFQESVIRDFEETTPFNRAEIAHAFTIFTDLYAIFENSPESANNSSPHHILTGHFANPDCELPVEFIANNFEKLRNNPFKFQICKAFCTSGNGLMSFTEFVDMVSSFSPKADLEKKIFHAFQIFDFDGDGLINRKDLTDMIDMMTPPKDNAETEENKRNWQTTKEWIVDGVFRECHKGVDGDQMIYEDQVSSTAPVTDPSTADSTSVVEEQRIMRSKESLTIEDFRYCLYRSPDFKNTFSFNI